MAANCPIPAAPVGSRKTTARLILGASCLSSSNHFPLMLYSKLVNPVALPPGRARLWTNPAPTGSVTFSITTGMVRVATLPPDASIDQAIENLLRTSQNEFPVVDGADRPAGVLGRSDLIRALKQHGPDARVADVMASPLPTVSHRACLEEAFRILQEKTTPAVGVIDANGQLIGLVTSETIGEMLMVRDALPKGTHLGPWSSRRGA